MITKTRIDELKEADYGWIAALRSKANRDLHCRRVIQMGLHDIAVIWDPERPGERLVAAKYFLVAHESPDCIVTSSAGYKRLSDYVVYRKGWHYLVLAAKRACGLVSNGIVNGYSAGRSSAGDVVFIRVSRVSRLCVVFWCCAAGQVSWSRFA